MTSPTASFRKLWLFAVGLTLTLSVWTGHLLGVGLQDAAAGWLAIAGSWLGLGHLLLPRSASALARIALTPIVGLAAWSCLSVAFAAARAVPLFDGLTLVGGLALFFGLSVRPLRSDAHVALPPGTLAAIGTALGVFLAGALWTYPQFIETSAGLQVLGYHVQDGLWFAGNCAAYEQGFPLQEYRFSGTTLVYQVQSLALGHGVAAAFGAPHAAALFYVATPLALALCALSGSVLVAYLVPAARWPWLVVGGLAASVLTDASSFLQIIGSADGLGDPVRAFILANRHTPWMLLDPPFTLAAACGLAAFLAWRALEEEHPVTAGALAGALFFVGGLSKGVLVPTVLPALALNAVISLRPGRSVRARVGAFTMLGAIVAGYFVQSALQRSAGYAEFGVYPWYMADLILHNTADLSLGPLRPGSRVGALVFGVLGTAWALFSLAPTAGRASRETQLAAVTMVATGLTVTNVFSWPELFGAELYFYGIALALIGPFAVAGAASLWPRQLVRPLVVFTFSIGVFGVVHLWTSNEVKGSAQVRVIETDQAAMLRFLREDTPVDARVLYYRWTLVDGDTRRFEPPVNDQYFLISGLGERATFTEGSYYGGIWRRDDVWDRRGWVEGFYNLEMPIPNAAAFLRDMELDYVVTESERPLDGYSGLLDLVWSEGGYSVYRVARPPTNRH